MCIVICSVSFSGDDFVSTKVKNHTIEKSVRHCVTYKNVNITSYEWYWTSCETRLHPLCEQAPAEGNKYLLKRV